MALSNKKEIKRAFHAAGKSMEADFADWFEEQCQMLVAHAIQGSGVSKRVNVDETKIFLRAVGKGL